VPALDLGQCLGGQLEVVERQPALLAGERAAVLPPRHHRDEVGGRGEFDVDLELLLEAGDRPEHGVLLGDDADVDVDGRGAPPVEDRRGAAGEVHPGRPAGLPAEGGHEPPDAGAVGQPRGARGRILEAHQPPDQGVVAGVRGVGVRLGEAQVEPQLRVGDGGGHVEAERAQAGRADGHQEGLLRLDPGGDVRQPPLHQLAARQRAHVHGRNATA